MEEEWELVLDGIPKQEIMALAADLKAKFLRISELLVRLKHHNVGMPHIKQLDGKLWEMRLNGAANIARSIYLIHKRKIIVLHTFIKKTQKTPKNALRMAQQRMKEIDL